jgi:hypothetical protein
MSHKTSDTKAEEANIAEAAEKTGLLIRALQSRLQDWSGDRAAHPQDETFDETSTEETPEDLEKQLQEFFEREAGGGANRQSLLNEIRNRVIDGVVDRIMLEWDHPQRGAATPLESQVIERLIRRVLERLNAAGLTR